MPSKVNKAEIRMKMTKLGASVDARNLKLSDKWPSKLETDQVLGLRNVNS